VQGRAASRTPGRFPRPGPRSGYAALRALLKWYDEALGHIVAGVIVEPVEPERLKEEHGLTARLLEFPEADERGKLD
jgi:uncharacterized membrane protein YidH (DUF202 family)